MPGFVCAPGFAKGMHRMAFEVTGMCMPLIAAAEAGLPRRV